MSRPPERAGVLVVRGGNVALIERRHMGGRHCFVVPGGGVEAGESIEQAAAREGLEELGTPVTIGPLRIRIDHLEEDRTIQRQWYFEATVSTDEIAMTGPELGHGPERGTYKAVWVPVEQLPELDVLPAAIAVALGAHPPWPDEVLEIDERPA